MAQTFPDKLNEKNACGFTESVGAKLDVFNMLGNVSKKGNGLKRTVEVGDVKQITADDLCFYSKNEIAKLLSLCETREEVEWKIIE